MKRIELTQGKVALVDDEDYEWLSQWKWYAAKRGRKWYAQRARRGEGGKKITVQMHREIICVPPGMDVDHIDRDGLNNQRANLRGATRQQNVVNTPALRNNTSGYKGVSWDKLAGRWSAKIRVNGILNHLGLYSCAKDAAVAYDKAALDRFGEFAYQNFV